MANPTTYFGWVMPNSADLVTDLPADFAVFGQGVDTSMQYLLGGTTGQVLSKTSATNMAFTWVTPTDQTPLTTKGDLFAFTTVDARLAVGSNNQTLYADSTAGTGLAWGASSKSTLTTTGDIVYASAANTLARLGIGSASQVLTVSGGGIPSWATAASSSGPAFYAYRATSQQSFSQNTYTKVQLNAENFDTANAFDSTTNYRFTPLTAGYYQVTGNIKVSKTGQSVGKMAIYKNGSVYTEFYNNTNTGTEYTNGNSTLVYLNGSTDYIELYGFDADPSARNFEFNGGCYMTGVWIRS